MKICGQCGGVGVHRVGCPTMVRMPSKGRPKEIVRLSEDAVEALAKKAKDEGVPKSNIMRRAIYRELGIKEDET